MVDLPSISAALASLKLAGDIAKTMVTLHDAQAFNAKLIEFQSAVIDAQNSALTANDERSTLVQRVTELEKQVADLKAWGTQKQNYELKQVSYTGTVAYVIKPEARGTEPPHCICPACYNNGKKGILQPTLISQGRNHLWNCPECSQTVIVARPLPGYDDAGNISRAT